MDQNTPGRETPGIPYLGALKIAVVVMGILIIVGVGVIVVTIAKRMAGRPEPAATDQTAPTPGSFDDVEIALPAGSEVAGTAVSGRRLVVETHAPDGTATILVLDLATGERLGSFRLSPSRPTPLQ